MDEVAPEDVGRIGQDPDAFAAFYRAHLEMVQRFIARRVSDPQLAADLTAEVFLAAVEASAAYRPERGSPEAWLTGVARNVVNAEFRRISRQKATVRRISGRRLLDTDSLAEIEARLDAEGAKRQLYQALAALPIRDRALLELVVLDGLSITDAAAVLGMKPGTARVRLHRSRARIRSELLPNRAALKEA